MSTSSASDTLGRKMQKQKVDKPKKCNQCDYASTSKSHLKNHLRTHATEIPDKRDQCDFSSSQTGHMKRHLEKSYKCLAINTKILFFFFIKNRKTGKNIAKHKENTNFH